jgi:hypothetical protein
VNAHFEFITDLWNEVDIILPVDNCIVQITENASRSTFERSEHKFSVSSFGSMSVLRSTK